MSRNQKRLYLNEQTLKSSWVPVCATENSFAWIGCSNQTSSQNMLLTLPSPIVSWEHQHSDTRPRFVAGQEIRLMCSRGILIIFETICGGGNCNLRKNYLRCGGLPVIPFSPVRIRFSGPPSYRTFFRNAVICVRSVFRLPSCEPVISVSACRRMQHSPKFWTKNIALFRGFPKFF